MDGDKLSQRAWEAQSVLRKPCGWKVLLSVLGCFLLDLVCEEDEFSRVRKAAVTSGSVGSSTPGN